MSFAHFLLYFLMNLSLQFHYDVDKNSVDPDQLVSYEVS